MRLFGINIPNPFVKEVHFQAPEKVNLPTGDVAWSEDAIYQVGKKTKYNPDDLIGKKGHGIYRKMMLDEQVKAVTKFKRDAITSREYIFEADIDELGEEEAERRIKISEAYLDKMKGNSVDSFNGIMSAMYQGVSYTEKVFMQIEIDGKTYWGIEKLPLKPFDTFEAEVDEYGNTTQWTQNVNGREQKIDIQKFIHHVQNPEYDAQYGQSELREAYRSWFSKDMAITFYNMWLERSASGFKWIKTKSLPNTTAYTALQNVLTNTVNGAGMILGIDDEFNIEFPAGNGEAFCNAIDKHDLGIARALLVPNLMGITPAGQTGSYSQSETQLEAFLWTLDQEALRLEEVLNEQLFRQLGEVNFGDDFWPRIKFQPISESRKHVIISLWKDLVKSGAAKASNSDEAHVRELLGFPEKDEESASGPIDAIPSGGDPGRSGGASDEPNNPDPNGDDEIEIEANSDNPRRRTPPRVSKDPVDETIKGEVVYLYGKKAFTKAMSRVDFRVIQRTTETMEVDKADGITSLFYDMTKDVVSQVREFYAKDELEENQVAIRFSAKDKAKMQRRINAALQDFWKVGQRHAENEIDKAKGLAFSMQADRERIKFISEDFFKQKSFKVAGKLTDDAIAIISQVIANGVKGGKTFKTIEEDIYRAMGANGFLAMEDYKEALGAAIDPDLKNPQARIDTMLRTNGFEAVNEARYSYFTDPQLDGFVEALEYSAVMDSRTTQICQHLDGHVHSTDSDVWQNNRPPNHYNCRSLLIPVTQTDTWIESEDPTIAPQKGFE